MFGKRNEKLKALQHDCKLGTEFDDDVLNQIIDSGIFIELRRKLCRHTMVHEHHPQTRQYFKSRAARKREEVKHLVNHLYMTHPFSLSCMHWEFFMFWVYMYMYVVSTISVVYLNVYVVLEPLNNARFFGDFIQIVYTFRLFFVGYYSTERGRTVMRPIAVARHQFMTYFFVDLLSTMPSIVRPLRWIYNLHEGNTLILKYMRIFSILKIFTVSRWLNALELFRQYMNYSSYWFKAIKSVLMYFTLLLWLYAAFFCITNVVYSESEVKLINIIERFYRANMLLLVITHGQQVLDSVKLVVLACFSLVIGYVMQLFLYAEVMQLWNKFASNTNENLLQQFKEYMKYKGLPLYIRNRMFTYFNFKFQNEFFNEAQINSIISDNLKQEIMMHLTKNHLEKSNIFKGVPERVLLKIVSRLKSEIYLPDDVIFTADTPGTCMYFIYFGTVAVYTAAGKEMFHLEDGGHFGEVSMLFEQPRLATVVAVTPCELFKLKRSDVINIVEPYVDIREQIFANARNTLIEISALR